MAIVIQLPPQLEEQLQAEWPDLAQHALEGFVIEAFRNGKLSSHEVEQLLHFNSRWEAVRFLSERGVYPGYELEDLQEDRDVLANLEKRAAK